MTRRYGIDVSHFQTPARPGGVPWSRISETSQFAIVRGSYGTWPDPSAELHTSAARIEAMQLGLYHFFCVRQSISAQMDVFCAQAFKCLIGPGDILPALDVEDDGGNLVNPSWEPLIRQAVDVLVSVFGDAMIYITQRDWARLGSPGWVLELPMWVANYTNAPKPATPGNVTPAIWQYRVGPYAQGAPFDPKQATSPNAIDHNCADAPLPVCLRAPSQPGKLPSPGFSPPSPQTLWMQRLDALTDDAYAHRNDTEPAPPPTEDA